MVCRRVGRSVSGNPPGPENGGFPTHPTLTKPRQPKIYFGNLCITMRVKPGVD